MKDHSSTPRQRRLAKQVYSREKIREFIKDILSMHPERDDGMIFARVNRNYALESPHDTPKGLTNLIRSVRVELAGPYSCPYCDRTFTQPGARGSHEKFCPNVVKLAEAVIAKKTEAIIDDVAKGEASLEELRRSVETLRGENKTLRLRRIGDIEAATEVRKALNCKGGEDAVKRAELLMSRTFLTQRPTDRQLMRVLLELITDGDWTGGDLRTDYEKIEETTDLIFNLFGGKV